MDTTELTLYKKFGMEPVDKSARDIFQELSAFWQHFALHKRTCDKTGKSMISVFDENCPYPVWHKDEWIKSAEPPSADFDPNKGFFEQTWELFQKCPIPHNIGAGNNNCEYTDDCWYSKNAYLSHSIFRCEDLSYCYRDIELKDCQFCVFSFRSELCTDLINCENCYHVTYALNSKQCRDSAFLFDCRNVKNCYFCWNLRNKEYCIHNEQYSKEEYFEKIREFNYTSRNNYEQLKKHFHEMLKVKAWWRASYVELCENSSGDNIERCKDCENCFLLDDSESCANMLRNHKAKDCLHNVSTMDGELIYYSTMAQDGCYEIRFCYNVIQSRFLEYCAHCFQCKNCFGCCGLVGKKYHIFNRPYDKEAYEKKVNEIKEHMRHSNEYGKFFPLHFAACPYDESLAGFYWPLSINEQQEMEFRTFKSKEQQNEDYRPISEIPDIAKSASEEICNQSFWDDVAKKPFKIRKADIDFCNKNGVPLPNSHYTRRIKENYKWIFFNGEMREAKCAETGASIKTSIPEEYDSRILSKEAYLEKIT